MPDPDHPSSADQKALEAFSEQILFAEELSPGENGIYDIQGLATSMSVSDFKKRVAEAIGSPSSWDAIKLVYTGRLLTEAANTLSSYDVHNGDTIFFVRSIMAAPPPYEAQAPVVAAEPELLRTLFFIDFDNKTMTLNDVPLDLTMGGVFQRLATEKRLDTSWLRFLWSNKQLREHMTVRDYGITDESKIHIVARMHGG